MSVLSNNIKAQIIETKTLEANINIQQILEMVSEIWEKRLDNYYIMESEPELGVDNYSDSVTIELCGVDKANISHIKDDVREVFEEMLESYIKEKQKTLVAKEEGENGSL